MIHDWWSTKANMFTQFTSDQLPVTVRFGGPKTASEDPPQHYITAAMASQSRSMLDGVMPATLMRPLRTM